MTHYLMKLILAIQNSVLFITAKLLFRKSHNKLEPERILVLRTCLLGDFLFAVPSLVALRRRFPKSKIVMLTSFASNPATFEGALKYLDASKAMPWLSFVVPKILDEAIPVHSFKQSELKSARDKVIKLDPEMCIVLSHPSNQFKGLLKKFIFLKYLNVSCQVYGWTIRANHSFMKKAQYKLGMFEHKIFGPLRSVTEMPQMPPLEKIKINFPLHIGADVESWANIYWLERGLDKTQVVAVAPGSIQPHKRWPIEKFVSLCNQLATNYSIKLLIVGTKGDYDLGEIIRRHVNHEVINLAGEISIPQAAALLKRCVMLVGNDSGAMHLGAAMGCPSVSIVPGIEYPGSIEPWGYFDLAVRHDVPCAPCYSFTQCPRGHNKCMVDLPVEKVLHQCQKVLAKHCFKY